MRVGNSGRGLIGWQRRRRWLMVAVCFVGRPAFLVSGHSATNFYSKKVEPMRTEPAFWKCAHGQSSGEEKKLENKPSDSSCPEYILSSRDSARASITGA